jgi:hypothetical protein
MAGLRSQSKHPKKGEVEVNQAYWKCLAKCHFPNKHLVPRGYVPFFPVSSSEGHLGSPLNRQSHVNSINYMERNNDEK